MEVNTKGTEDVFCVIKTNKFPNVDKENIWTTEGIFNLRQTWPEKNYMTYYGQDINNKKKIAKSFNGTLSTYLERQKR